MVLSVGGSFTYPKYSAGTCPTVKLSTTIRMRTALELTPDLHFQKPSTKRRSVCTAVCRGVFSLRLC